MDTVQGMYYKLFYEIADPRVKDWLLMTSPWPLVAILTIYLTLIKIIVPKFMEDRKPYNLKTIIKWYNIWQIVTNITVVWGLTTSGWTTTYNLRCEPPDYSMNPEALRMLRFMWWSLALKLFELVETVFFLLRKKDGQASFLHVYHHISTAIIAWSAVKYVGGGGISLQPIINCSVHVVMYNYYLLSSEGSPRVKRFLNKYKKWLTIIQMAQFILMSLHAAQMMLPSCEAPKGLSLLYFPNMIFIYYMFYRFFKNNYTKEKKLHNINVLKKDS